MFNMAKSDNEDEPGVMSEEMAAATAMPLRSLLSFSPDAKIEQLVQTINQAVKGQE